VAKATAEMLQQLESSEAIAPAEKEFERAQEIERAFEKVLGVTLHKTYKSIRQPPQGLFSIPFCFSDLELLLH
jgi:hypothetical protein